jgi:adenylosuccinate lyase
MHELIRKQAMQAWESIRAGETNPLAANLAKDSGLLQYLDLAQIHAMMDYQSHVGDAPQRTLQLAETILGEIQER